MRFSILHISDLHQDLRDEIPNTWLLDSLARDIERFSTSDPAILRPSVCIVSGDIVYGISGTAPNSATELTRQYTLAHDFLVELCDKFFDGDRDRVVILPGNHDVDYSQVIASGAFVPVPAAPEEKRRLVSELFSPNSNLRWTWGRIEFFRIDDTTKYNNRLKSFADMYERFYLGRRTYPLDPQTQYDIFDYPSLGLSVVALNSCHNNDPMNRAGSINPTAMAAAYRQIRNPSRSGWVIAATWHHNFAGGLFHEDFLDPGFLQLLIEGGASLGFHGHQHRSDCFDERYKLGDKPRKITIVSAGTLCAEPKGLSPGVPRSYNVVELDTEAWRGKVHLRQMVNQMQSMPVWGPGLFVDTNASFMNFDLSRPVSSRPPNLDVELALERASDFLGKAQWTDVLIELKNHHNHPMARRMLVRSLQELRDDRLTIETLREPQSLEESVLVGGAILESGTLIEIKQFLSLSYIVQSADASIGHIVTRLQRRLAT